MNTSRKHLPADERRSVIIQTVLELASEQNPSKITTAAIAERMGLTQGALFRHFSSKEAVVHAVMEWVSVQLLARIEAIDSDPSSFAVLKKIFMTHALFITEYPGIPRILFSELQGNEGTEVKNTIQVTFGAYKKHLCFLFEQGKASGEIMAELDNETAAMVFLGMIQGLVVQSLVNSNAEYVSKSAAKAFEFYQRAIARPS